MTEPGDILGHSGRHRDRSDLHLASAAKDRADRVVGEGNLSSETAGGHLMPVGNAPDVANAAIDANEGVFVASATTHVRLEIVVAVGELDWKGLGHFFRFRLTA